MEQLGNGATVLCGKQGRFRHFVMTWPSRLTIAFEAGDLSAPRSPSRWCRHAMGVDLSAGSWSVVRLSPASDQVESCRMRGGELACHGWLTVSLCRKGSVTKKLSATRTATVREAHANPPACGNPPPRARQCSADAVRLTGSSH